MREKTKETLQSITVIETSQQLAPVRSICVHLRHLRTRILKSQFSFLRFGGGSRAAQWVKFPPANRSRNGVGGRNRRPKCHLPCSAEKLGELGDPGFQARLFWKRLWGFFLVTDPPQGRQHVGERWFLLLGVPRPEGET